MEAATQVEEQKMEEFHIHNLNYKEKDPLNQMFLIANTKQLQRKQLQKLNEIFGRMAAKLEAGSKAISQFIGYIITQSIRKNDPARKVSQKQNSRKQPKTGGDARTRACQSKYKMKVQEREWISLGQYLYALVNKLFNELKTDPVWLNVLFLLSLVFPANPNMKFAWRFHGNYIRPDFEIVCPIGLHQVIHNIMLTKNLINTWNGLHYTKKDVWKIWCENLWLSDTLSKFVIHVRQCIKAHVAGTDGVRSKQNKVHREFA